MIVREMAARFWMPDPLVASSLIFACALGAIAGAWIFQSLGFAPCELCLEQRPAYYFGVPLAAIAMILAVRQRAPYLPSILALIGAIFAANAFFGAYHSGVEFKFWPGPTGCTGAMTGPLKAADLLSQLAAIKVVRCDEVSLRIFGLSLANWNTLISAALSALAWRGARAAS